MPIDFWKTLDSSGNPTAGVPFCSTCPLNMAQYVFRLLPRGQLRLYPRWLPKTGKFSVEDVGENKLLPLANRWLRLQGANPDQVDYCPNGGRKALGLLCNELKTPYRESFEAHGDHPKTWHKHYQSKMIPDKSFKRRTQSTSAEDCLKMHKRFAMYIGRGPPIPQCAKLSRTVFLGIEL